jgi:excisionase family DNA binding protein
MHVGMCGDARRWPIPAGRVGSLVGMSAQTAPESLLTPAEVARLANVSLSTVRREVDRGGLRAVHVGRQLRIDPADFRAYLDRERA